MKNKYAKAYTELLEILKYFPKSEYSKIPKEKIEFYENNRDKNYKFIINPNRELSKQNISRETNALIITLYRDFFATETQKIKLNEVLESNKRTLEAEKRVKYSPDEIFKNRSENGKVESNVKEENQISEYKEGFFMRIKKYILKLLHINNL